MQHDSQSPYDLPQSDTTSNNEQSTIPLSQNTASSSSFHSEPTIPFSQNDDFSTQPQAQAYVPQAATPPDVRYQGTMAQGAPQPEMPPAGPAPKKKQPGKQLLIGSILTLVLVSISVIVLIALLIANTQNHAVASTSTTSPTAVASTTPARAKGAAASLALYRATIRRQIAQGLHLSPAQLEAQLNAQKTLSSIASAQGISSAQLQTIVTNAFRNGLQGALNAHTITQNQVDTLIQRMLTQPQTLTRFLGVKAKNGTNATSRVTPTPTL